MKSDDRKVAEFRQRLAVGQASWLIDIASNRRVTIDLTREQQALLMRATRRVIPSLTVVFQSPVVRPPEHAALCTLTVRDTSVPRARKAASKTARTPTRSVRARR